MVVRIIIGHCEGCYLKSDRVLVLRISPDNIDWERIRVAARIIREGGLVVFPTETVYGLGANALSPEAVRKIFIVKGRPLDNPLIVHVADKSWVYRYAEYVSEEAKKLIEKFWPGPLTLVLRKKDVIPDIVTAGLNTVGIRMPSHNVALALISEANVPVAAPSANRFGRPSPTRVEHVIEDLDGEVDCIIDSGETFIGLESTVLDLTGDRPMILRPGYITKEMIEDVLGREVEYMGYSERPKSPGIKYRHYAPKAKLYLVVGSPTDIRTKVKELVEELKGERVAVVVTEENKNNYEVDTYIIGSRRNLSEIARNLFDMLRSLDSRGYTSIIFEGLEERGLGYAIMNRLRKAATKIIEA